MQKMRVSAMKITKADGQHLEVPPEIMEIQRQSLRQRLALIEKKHRATREAQAAEQEKAAANRPPRRFASRLRHERPNTNSEKSTHTWRRDVLLQAGICAVILLSVIGFRAIDSPVTNRITDGITEAVTMDIDISETLGELQFVKNVMPESVLVFWEGTADPPTEFSRPISDGTVAVAYSEKVSGILLAGADADVYAAADGEVISVTKGRDGDFILRLKHSGGIETLYGFLQGVKVAAGDRVSAGQNVGLAMPTDKGVQLYFQASRDGKVFDPVPLLVQ